MIDSNYTLYELNCADLIFNDLNLQFSSIPTAINSNNKLYLYNHDDLFIMITNDNFPIIIVTPPNLISIENFHDYTIFATHENKFSIFITELTDIINIESDLSNYIEFKLSPELGKILKIIIYKDNVYIAQQYGISKFTFDEDSATIKNFCSIQSSIFAETISLIDDYIVFLSSSGLYLFDGNDIKQIFTTITKNINGEDFKSVVFNNKYYLKSKYYINDISESVILQFDIENNYCTIYKIGEIVDIYVIKNLQNYMLVATIKDENNVYEILTYDKTTVTKFDKYLKFNKIAFDETPEKVLSEVKIQSIGKYQLIINSDTESSQFDINGSAHIKNIGLKGQIFEIEIKSKHAFVIESILLKTVPSSEG